ncbi:MAG: lipopolysaccharide biosynthesis protein [Anaerolineales bacterium]|nr:lipopolysaccharide biosynthesis protein [Anaerolineales bacterium]
MASTAPPTPPPKLSLLAMQGTFWSYLSFISGKLLVFFTTVILARLLTPTEFGVMGYCLIVLQYLDLVSDISMDVALISRREKLEEAANAAFGVSLVTSLLIYAAAWVVAPAVASFFKEPEVAELLRTVIIVLPLAALANVPGALLQRELRFKAKLLPDITRSVVKGGLSIGLALQGFGVWSLVWGQIGGELATTGMVWLLARWRPTLRFEAAVTRDLIRIGLHIMTVSVAGTVLANVDYVLVGGNLGPAALGLYTLAYRIPELVINNSMSVIGRVAYPILARIQTDRQRLHMAYFTYLRYITLFTFPAGAGLALLATPFIHVAYTVKWAPAIPVMQAIAVAIALGSLGYLPGVILKATNRPEILNAFTLVKLPLTIGLLWYATRWGITGVALAQVGVALVNLAITTVLTRWALGIPVAGMLTAIRPAFLATLVMTGGVAAVAAVWPGDSLGTLLAWAGLGVLLYGAALAVFSRETVERAGQIVLAVLPRRSPAP